MGRILLVLLLAVPLGFTAARTEHPRNANPHKQKTYQVARIRTPMGEILFVLYDQTPRHKASFIKLAGSHYWDSLTFNRVIKDFVAQGGCPDTPQGFGYKVMWFSVKTSDPAAVIDALQFGEAIPANWASGMAAMYERDAAEAGEAWVFVTPPLNGWVLAVSPSWPYPVSIESESAGEHDIGKRFDAATGAAALERGDGADSHAAEQPANSVDQRGDGSVEREDGGVGALHAADGNRRRWDGA